MSWRFSPDSSDYADKYQLDKGKYYCRIEMCNVIYTHLVQLIRFGYGKDVAEDFLENETESGFINEITQDLESRSPKVSLLKHGKIKELLDLAEKEANSKKLIRWFVMRIFAVLK